MYNLELPCGRLPGRRRFVLPPSCILIAAGFLLGGSLPTAAKEVTVRLAPGLSYGFEATRWRRDWSVKKQGQIMIQEGASPPDKPDTDYATITVRVRGRGHPAARLNRHLKAANPSFPNVHLTGSVARIKGFWRAPYSTAGFGAAFFEEGVIALAEARGHDVVVIVGESYGRPSGQIVDEVLAGLKIPR